MSTAKLVRSGTKRYESVKLRRGDEVIECRPSAQCTALCFAPGPLAIGEGPDPRARLIGEVTMLPCHVCDHPGIHAVVIGEDGALPASCGNQCRFCMAEDAEQRRTMSGVRPE